MKYAMILTFLLMIIAGCSTQEPVDGQTTDAPAPKAGTNEFLLTDQDVGELGLTIGTPCRTEDYETGEFSPLAQNSFCNYTVKSMNNTEVIIQMSKYTNQNDLNGSYQYGSLHYRSVDGLLSQDDFGDQSRFYVNNEGDYGAEFNPPGVYYYSLYFTKDEYLVQISSSGRDADAKEKVAEMGRRILSKFD